MPFLPVCFRRLVILFMLALLAAGLPLSAPARAQGADGFDADCTAARGEGPQRVVCADLVALDQMLVYNRFGSFNPYGMIFALRRDVVRMADSADWEPPDCSTDTATQAKPADDLQAGQVRLRDCRRPRPLVLRANVGDLLFVRVENLLAPEDRRNPPARDLSRNFCPDGNGPVGDHISHGSKKMVDHDEALCEDAELTKKDDDPEIGDDAEPEAPGRDTSILDAGDWPRTRSLNLLVEGLMPMRLRGADPHPACLGLGAVDPGDRFECLYEVVQEGTHFLASRAAPSGGQGDGGSITHGLFGAVMAERPGTRWYRSQVSQAAMDAAWPRDKEDTDKITKPARPEDDGQKKVLPRHARAGLLDYEKTLGGIPVLNMARAIGTTDFRNAQAVEIVHADLNAIIWCDHDTPKPGGYDPGTPLGCMDRTSQDDRTEERRFDAYREFSVFFHDELKTFYTRNFEELSRFGQLAGVRDGFAINYGASGMGTMLLANRKGIGPAAACAECLYEEFFLTSWANGDPALLEWYADDPSNVHHSYLNDPVVFRNFHAGPKETHVFHLHAHQWFAGNDQGRGSYLDSQTVAPGQGFTYNIYHGGRGRETGQWYLGGSGNRNRTVGDSIFHCHLYPHFAQGMWALWRVHDVFEDGTRKLPDGQAEPGLSAEIRDALAEAKDYFTPQDPDSLTDEEKAYLAQGDFFARTGSVDPETGKWLGPLDDDPSTIGRIEGAGTPIPALVPLPGEALPPLPKYADTPVQSAPDEARQDETSLQPDIAPRRPPLWRGNAAGGPERLVRAQAPASRTTEETPPPAPRSRSVPDAMPGYPFYIAGQAGHRPPQAPHDIAKALGDEGVGPNAPAAEEYLSGGLGRHVITRAERDLPLRLSEEIKDRDAALAAALAEGNDVTQRNTRARLETLRSQMVAKALALGDMTAHLHSAQIRALDPEGEPLERAAMAFHHKGDGLTMRAPGDQDAAFENGAYKTPRAPLPGQTDPKPVLGKFDVNGAPAAPGAPFADPCGGAPGRDMGKSGTDPLTKQTDYVIDTNLSGFRRYRVSAVQLDLVVNQAGWHDPQARIDVLTSLKSDATGNTLGSPEARALKSDAFKLPGDPGRRISPTTRDDVQPFFFRARSGECIEFRHTNELPKDLELDDFQVRTPTDTIGQHIHLVKFDVTSSDGSGNGWNYEDGTFAADELMARRCATLRDKGSLSPSWEDADLGAWGTRMPTEAECSTLTHGRIWRLPVTQNRHLFQTTVQRWFADPIITLDGKGEARDRTMRTVFSHDHFGPSSIQQHGFYTALLIEPKVTEVCDPHREKSCKSMVLDLNNAFALQEGTADWIGTHKIVKTNDDPMHPDYREFALAVADFALLYDPRDREDVAAIEPVAGAQHKGMARIYCEALSAARGLWRGRTANQCGLPDDPADPDTPPAWWAAGAPGDRQSHRDRLHGNLMDMASVDALRRHLIDFRARAASPDGRPVRGGRLAKPVAPPERPESISVDHHDPYLVNYRNAPLPLRLGTKNADGSPHDDCEPLGMTRAGQTRDSATHGYSEVVSRLMAGTMPRCSYAYQLAGDRGDAAHVLSSWDMGNYDTASAPPRDPETPQFEAYQDERILFRLIQGAQEVQHVFNIAGQAGPRNVDQRYSQGMRDLAVSVDPARMACFDAVRKGHPEDYEDWLDLTPAMRGTYDANNPAAKEKLDRFDAFDKAVENCDNLEGYTFAQEVGISEHFEIRTRLRSDMATIEMVGTQAAAASPAAQSPADIADNTKNVSDYLYNFGTLDAMWNGAWGLLRVYKGPGERKTLLTGWQDRAAPRVLVPVGAAKKPNETADAADAQAQPLNETPGCPLPADKALGHETQGLVVALRTADAFGSRGTDYGGHRNDPDGLMLALLNPWDLKLRPQDRESPGRDINNRDHWLNLSRRQVLDAVRAAYARPEPFVMRVNAGDCVVLRYVNLLQAGPNGGLPDALGDALMPKIAPLNVDAEHAVERSARVSGGDLETSVAGTLTPLTTPATGLRPSARLGLSIGLPGGDLIRNLPLGYGLNRPPMAPAAGDRAEVSEVLRFYAGRMRIALPHRDGEDSLIIIANNVLGKAREQDESLWADRDPMSKKAKGNDPVHLTILGVNVSFGNFTLSDEETRDLGLLAQAELHRHIHWIPYAFGPVPVRVTGDMVSQTTHGLFGVIDVLPRHWDIPASVNPQIAASDDGPRGARVPGTFGAGVRYENVVMNPYYDPEKPETRTDPIAIREFVIFYQDGLNHHDSQSEIRWSWQDGTPETARIVPDCPVCDDSYDWGDQGVSYRSRPFASLLRYRDIVTRADDGRVTGAGRVEASDDLNAIAFPGNLFQGQPGHGPDRQPLTLAACPGEEVLIRVVHPGGRARQRAFVMNGLGYDDLFPGFGFPNAALVAPGKVVSAWLHPPTVPGPDGTPQDVQGKVLWHDGPTYLMAGGTWGLVDFTDTACPGNSQ